MSTVHCPECGADYTEDVAPDDPACPNCGSFLSQKREWYSIQELGDAPAALPVLFLDLWANYQTNRNIFEHSRYGPEGPIIRHFACELFKHVVFTDETMQRLTDWLKAECGPDVDVFGLPLAEVAQRLREQCKSNVSAQKGATDRKRPRKERDEAIRKALEEHPDWSGGDIHNRVIHPRWPDDSMSATEMAVSRIRKALHK